MSGETRVDRERVAALLYAHGLRSGDYATYDAAYCAQVADAVLALLPAPHPQGGTLRALEAALDAADEAGEFGECCVDADCRACNVLVWIHARIGTLLAAVDTGPCCPHVDLGYWCETCGSHVDHTTDRHITLEELRAQSGLE